MSFALLQGETKVTLESLSACKFTLSGYERFGVRTLTAEEIRSCVKGTSFVRDNEQGLEFLRFPEKHLQVWHDAGEEGRLDRAYSNAGVRLDFITDSEDLAIEAGFGRAARKTALFDVWVNESFVAYVGETDPADTLSVSTRLPGSGKHRRVTVYFPHLRAVFVRRIQLSPNAYFEPVSAKATLLTLGDSITQGMHSLHPSLTWPAVLAAGLNMDLHNQGVGGCKYEVRTLPEPPTDNPALITVAFGVNDWNKGMLASNAKPYLEQLLKFYPDKPIFVLEPIWFLHGDGEHKPKISGGLTFDEYRQQLRMVVESIPQLIMVPRQQLLPDGPIFLSDGVHPNTQGHMVYGANAARMLGASISTNK